MGMTTLAASRIYKAQTRKEMGEDLKFAWEKFGNVGIAKVRLIRLPNFKLSDFM